MISVTTGHVSVQHVENLNVAFCFSVALHPQRPYRLLETGSSGDLPLLSHSSWARLGFSWTRECSNCWTVHDDAVLIELYLSIPLSLTMTLFQGHISVTKNVMFVFDLAETSYGC